MYVLISGVYFIGIAIICMYTLHISEPTNSECNENGMNKK